MEVGRDNVISIRPDAHQSRAEPSRVGQSDATPSRAKSACVHTEADSLSVGFCSLLVRRASSQFKLNQSHCQFKLFSAIIMSSTLTTMTTTTKIKMMMMMILDSSPFDDECVGERRQYWTHNVNKDYKTSGQFVEYPRR